MFDQAQAALETIAEGCPDHRQLIHGDLLYGNVLDSPDDRITALFDWGNSLVGDPLYDIAWLIFWAPWHPGIRPAKVRSVAEAQFGDSTFEQRLTSAPAAHRAPRHAIPSLRRAGRSPP